MSTETQVEAGEQTQNESPEEDTNVEQSTATSEVVIPEATDESESQTPDKDERDKALARMERRINKKHAEAAAANERARLLEERLQKYEQQAEPEEIPGAKAAEVDPHLLARHIATVEKVTEKSNAIAADGKKRYANFGESLGTVIEEVGPLFDGRGLPLPVGEAILEAEDPAGLLNYLGTNPEAAAALSGLSPTQLGRHIERIEAQMKVKPKTSSAPKPLEPVRAVASSNDLSDDLSADEWKRRREKQLRSR